MSRSRHTEAQIITALKQVEAGRTVDDVAREQGVSKHTIYAWKAKYGGMEVSEAEEVKHLRDENARLKRLVADLSLDKDMLQSVIRKTPWARRAAIGSAALAGGVQGQRAPRLRADGSAEIERPVSKPSRRQPGSATAAGASTLRLPAAAFVPPPGDGSEPQEGAARVSRVGPDGEAHAAQASAAGDSAAACVDGAQPGVGSGLRCAMTAEEDELT